MNRELISLITVGGISFSLIGLGIWYYFKVQQRIVITWRKEDRESYYKQFKLGMLITFITIILLPLNTNIALILVGLGIILHSVIFFNSNVTTDFSVLFWAHYTGLGKNYIKFERIINLLTGVTIVLLATKIYLLTDKLHL